MRRLSTAVLVAVALLGCSADAITSDTTAYAGDYALISINANTLPYALLTTPTETLLETSETFTLLSNGTFVDVTHYEDTKNSVVTHPADTLTGTFIVRGQTANFTTAGGRLFIGTMGTGAFTIEGASTVFFYKKP